jgi:hypothetical protein
MDTAGWTWMILFYFFSGLFITIAGFVIIFGLRDLIELLSKTEKNK